MLLALITLMCGCGSDAAVNPSEDKIPVYYINYAETRTEVTYIDAIKDCLFIYELS